MERAASPRRPSPLVGLKQSIVSREARPACTGWSIDVRGTLRCSAYGNWQVQLSRAGLASFPSPVPSPPLGVGAGADATALVRVLMLSLGETLSVWARPAAAAVMRAVSKTKDEGGGRSQGGCGPCPRGTTSNESRPTGDEALAIAGSHVGLLRALFTKGGWHAALAECVREVGFNIYRGFATASRSGGASSVILFSD